MTVCDTNKSALEQARKEFGVEVVEPNAIYDQQCHIYSPCAIGQTVNTETVERLKCDIIAGAANNQLVDNSMYARVEAKKIIYCPDFAINSGGIICVAGEYNQGGWKESWVTQKVENIYNTIHKILEESEKRKKFPEVVALELAKERISQAGEKRK
jgi:leucine dehydrogenase